MVVLDITCFRTCLRFSRCSVYIYYLLCIMYYVLCFLYHIFYIYYILCYILYVIYIYIYIYIYIHIKKKGGSRTYHWDLQKELSPMKSLVISSCEKVRKEESSCSLSILGPSCNIWGKSPANSLISKQK